MFFISAMCALFSPIGLFLISICIIIIYFATAKTNFSSIRLIITDYFSIFKDAKKHVLFFWGTPILLSLSVSQVSLITEVFSGQLIVFLSILISGFFAMLSILASKNSHEKSRLYQEVLSGAVSVVLVEILLCLLALLLTLAIMLLSSRLSTSVLIIISFLVYYSVFVMVFNILIIIKRLKALIDND